jgi:nucleoside-diphosphate-sugar epimerase
MTKHLVTGASGFLGLKIAERLLAQGDEVIGVDLRPPVNMPAGLKFSVCDIRDSENLSKLLVGVSVVHHAAALVPLTKKYNEFLDVNVEGSRNVARLAKQAKVEFFIHVSSSAIFGKTGDAPISNNSPLTPIEPYGQSKLDGERAVESELAHSKVGFAMIRPRTILGTERGGIFDLFFRWVKEGQPIFTIGSGLNKFQFVHVDDLIDAIILVTNTRSQGKFNVGTDEFESLNELFAYLIAHAKSSSAIVHLPVHITIMALTILEKLKLSPLAPWHYKTFHNPFYFDLSELNALGWKPKYSNKHLICAAYDSYLLWSKEENQDPSSPHRSKLKAGILGPIQKVIKWFL